MDQQAKKEHSIIRQQTTKLDRKAGVSAEAILANRNGQLSCARCKQAVKKKDAFRGGGGALKCPACGGMLDRGSI